MHVFLPKDTFFFANRRGQVTSVLGSKQTETTVNAQIFELQPQAESFRRSRG